MNKIIYPLSLGSSQEELNVLAEWIKTNPKLSMGELTKKAEQKFADWAGIKYCVFSNSGSSANLLAYYSFLLSNRLKNRKVVVPSVAWSTTISPAIQLGFEPFIVGADCKTYGIDLDGLEEVCKKHNPGLVVWVDVLGVPHHKKEIQFLKNKYGFYTIEDACAAVGSSYFDGIKCGAAGDIGNFSAYMGHQIQALELGMSFTNDKHLRDLMIMARSHGWSSHLDKKDYEQYMKFYNLDTFHSPFTFLMPGFNVRPTEISSFLSLRQIEKFDWIVRRRFSNHKRYKKNLPMLESQEWNSGDTVSSISYGCLANSGSQRKEIVEQLSKNGVETRMFSAGALHKHPFWEERYGSECFGNKSICSKIHSRGFFLPSYPEMEEKDIDFICDIVKNAL